MLVRLASCMPPVNISLPSSDGLTGAFDSLLHAEIKAMDVIAKAKMIARVLISDPPFRDSRRYRFRPAFLRLRAC